MDFAEMNCVDAVKDEIAWMTLLHLTARFDGGGGIYMQGLFMVIGFLTVLAMAVFLIFAIVEIVKNQISELRIKHIQKHRFDKPPTAKCYCRDCKRWNVRDGNGYCEKFKGWCTADNWFCWDAEPTKKHRK